MEAQGKAALVTGGGSGIGRSTALLLGSKGARVAIVDVDEVGGRTVAKEIEASGGAATFIAADCTRDEDLQRAFREAEAAWGGLDIVFNNAGMLTGAPTFPDTAVEKWSKVVQLNFWAVIRGVQLGVEALGRRGGGVIVNTASMSGINPWAMDPVYSATKGGVVFLTKALAGLKAARNIRVNCVCPTLVETPLLTGAEDATIAGLLRYTRLGPEDVAKAVLRLIEDEDLAGAAMTVLPDQEPALA